MKRRSYFSDKMKTALSGAVFCGLFVRRMFDLGAVSCYYRGMKVLKKRSLFWDVNDLDFQKNEQFIIERILDFGDEKDFHWALSFYGEEKLKNVLLRSKTIAKKSLFFWCGFFNLDRKKCLSNQSAKKQSAFWKR